MEHPLLVPHPEGAMRRPSRVHPGYPFPIRILGNGQKRPKATGRNYAAGPFIHKSGKLQGVKRPKFRWLRACLSRFSRGWPQKGPFGPFLGPGGQGSIRKRQFGRQAKTAAENGSNPVRLLKCHVRREKGPTRGPGGPSVTGRGAHFSSRD